jgi:hypothetical protein
MKHLKRLEFVFEGWGCSLVVEHLPSMCKALGSITSTEKNENKSQQNKQTEKACLTESSYRAVILDM